MPPLSTFKTVPEAVFPQKQNKTGAGFCLFWFSSEVSVVGRRPRLRRRRAAPGLRGPSASQPRRPGGSHALSRLHCRRRTGPGWGLPEHTASQSEARTHEFPPRFGTPRANPTSGPPSRGGRRQAPASRLPPFPRGLPLSGLARQLRSRGPDAAKRPGRAGSHRKDARARGGSEVIKGKEPAAGGSGRFSCFGRCCLVCGPLEGRSLEGRRCRPQ